MMNSLGGIGDGSIFTHRLLQLVGRSAEEKAMTN
jgi:hypothetical protein